MLETKSNILNQLIETDNLKREVSSFIQSEDVSRVVIFIQEKVKNNASWTQDISQDIFMLSDSEKAKDISSVIDSINYLAEIKADQNTLLIAYGGGSVSDHVGFIASIFKRGVKYINIPTTLVGMIDASIGGKTAINTETLKNQIGTFYQPSKVLIDFNLIDTMPDSVINDGLGEMFKYTILDGKDMMDTFQEYLDSRDRELLESLVKRCYKFKLNIVAIDERDQGVRKTLNLGHTFGHAIESDSRNQTSHGEAVINGILMASYLSFKKEYLNKKFLKQIESIGLRLINQRFQTNNIDQYVNFMLNDKKNIDNKIGIIMIEDIGKVKLDYFSNNDIKDFLESYNEYISN